MILGVCEWLGNKLDIEPKNVRIGFVLAVLFAGLGIGIYLILWIVKILSKQ